MKVETELPKACGALAVRVQHFCSISIVPFSRSQFRDQPIHRLLSHDALYQQHHTAISKMAGKSLDQPPAKRVKCVAYEILDEGHVTKSRRYDFTQTFNVLVRQEKKRFTVYHDIMSERSSFFKAAPSSRWTQDSQAPTDLTDHYPETFTNYLQLIYGGGCIQPDEEVTQYVRDGGPKGNSRPSSGSAMITTRRCSIFKYLPISSKTSNRPIWSWTKYYASAMGLAGF